MEEIYIVVKPVVSFLMVETIVLQLLPAGEFRKMVKRFSGIVLILLLLKPVLSLTDRNVDSGQWIQKAQIEQELKNCENLIKSGDAYLAEKSGEQYRQLIPSDRMKYMETYNASEGFFAIQNDPASDDLLLMLDYGVYYEFLPVRDLDDPSRAVPLDRRGMPVPGMQTIFKSIHPSSVKGKGDVRNASLRSAQPLFLQYHDGRDPGCD